MGDEKDKRIKRLMRIYKHGCKTKDIIDWLAEDITDMFKTRKESKHYVQDHPNRFA